MKPPVINYLSLKVADKTYSFNDTCKVSFNAPYNEIKITFKVSTDINDPSISYYAVRVTYLDEPYDVDLGELLYSEVNIAKGEEKTISIVITRAIEHFKQDGNFRISLYAKSALDDSWDATYLYFTLEGLKFVPSGSDGYEIYSTKPIPI